MFGIYKNDKRFNTKRFDTYEQARSYVRKYIRKNADKMFNINSSFNDAGWLNHSNPSHSMYKFAIRNLVK